MKKLIILVAMSAVTALGVAFAGDFITGVEYQNGIGTNGASRAAPSTVADGVAVQSSAFAISSRPVADYAKVTLAAVPPNSIAPAPAALSALQCWHYTVCAGDGGVGFCWSRCPYLDIAVDAGAGVTPTSIEFPAVGPLPIEQPGNRYDWAAVNVGSTGAAQDAGVFVMIQFVTP